MMSLQSKYSQRHVILAFAALALLGFMNLPALQAEEASETASTGQKASEFREKRKEKMEAWLEKHPNIKEKMDTNDDGTVDRAEFKQAKKERHKNNAAWDRDNNPPGKAGGPGTNWENPPGPAGGPGASPNRRRHRK